MTEWRSIFPIKNLSAFHIKRSLKILAGRVIEGNSYNEILIKDKILRKIQKKGTLDSKRGHGIFMVVVMKALSTKNMFFIESYQRNSIISFVQIVMAFNVTINFENIQLLLLYSVRIKGNFIKN